jgi:anti-anti-sigma factor
MQVSVESVGAVRVVSLVGRADSVTAPALGRQLTDLVWQAPTGLVLDLSAVTYISSAGLSTLVTVLKVAEARGGSLVLCGLTVGVRQVFSLAGLLTRFVTADGRADAVETARNGCTPTVRDR